MSILQGSSTRIGAAGGFALLVLAAGVSAAPAAGSKAHTAPPAVEPVARTAEPGSPPVRHDRIRLATGVELHVAQAGPADGVPVVLLHGFTDSWFSWSMVIERLPADIRVIVPTQRGHGDSGRPGCCYAIGDFARDVVALLDALDIRRAHVIGHSMGGLVAQRVAIDSPERVNRLVIVGSAASVRNEAVIEFNEVVQQLSDPIDPAFIRDFQLATTALPLPPEFLERVVQESAKLPARMWREVLGGLLAPEALHDVSRITAPTLIVWGAQDAFFPRSQQEELVRAIDGARLLVYPDAAHSPTWEIPGRFVDDVMAFLGIGGKALDLPGRQPTRRAGGAAPGM